MEDDDSSHDRDPAQTKAGFTTTSTITSSTVTSSSSGGSSIFTATTTSTTGGPEGLMEVTEVVEVVRETVSKEKGEVVIDEDKFYEREDVQKKTFAKWINSQLAKGNHPLVTDLFYDLRDGTRLLALLEVLTGSTYKREKGKMRVHHLNNVSRGLSILEQHNVKLVNISNDDIVDGSAKLTLGLVWSIILHWQVQGVLKDVMADLQQTNLEKTLLAWCRQTTKGYHGVDVRNFTTSWTDGLAFNALIHRHRPDLFDWPTVAKKLPFARLEQAFRLANKEFGIERLLDPEDVNTQVPDKKSMMMYIMCLFQALPKASFTMESLDVSIQSDSSFTMEASGGDEKGRPLSTVSIGLGGYQRTLEEVLTWLLGAEDRLAAMPPIAEEPEEVKQQFHQLEDLMLELTAKQGGIGDVLGEGTRLLKEGVMGEEEEEEIRVQMKLLNTRWEDLRVKAMDRQTQLHDCLMQLQQSQLENLKSWLTATEDRISNMSEVGPTTEDLRAQVAAHHKLQQDLEGEQANINSLSNMVVVVDEGNSDAAYSNLEDELNALGERWAHICRWAEQRWTTLQVLTVHWEQLEREMEKLGKWLDENEAQLKQMESNPSTDQEHLLRQAGTLQVLQSEMDIQQRRFALLQEESSKVLSNLPKDSPAHTRIPETLENLQDRWDCLVAIIEAQNQRLAASGIDIKRTVVPSDTDGGVVSSSTSTITHEGATMITKVITTKTTTTKTVEEGSFKRQKLEGESCEEFNVALNQLGGWMDTVQDRLQPKQMDDLSYEQLVQLCQHLQDEVRTQQEEYNKVMSLGQSAISETATIGESASDSESKVTDFAARWQALSEMMANLQSKIEFMTERKKLTAELSAMEIQYQGFQRWFDTVRTVSENEPNAITSQVEQCKAKISGMKNHEQRLKEISETINTLSSKWPSDAAAVVQLGRDFVDKWETLLLKLVDWGNALSSELEKQPPQSYLEALTALKRWLTNVEAAVTTEPLVISKLSILSDQLHNYKELLKTVEVEESSLAYINRTGNELISRSEVNTRLKGDLVELNKRWESAVAALKSRVENVEKAIEMLGQYRDEVSGLKSWLAEVDVFLHAEDAALGDIETLEAQLEQSNALQDDIATLETNVNSIKTTSGHIIQETNDEELRNEVSQQLKDLSDRWDVVLDLARRQNKSLKDALAKSQKVHEDISKLNMWLDKLELEFPAVKPIETSSELNNAIEVISKLREDIASHTDTFRSVNEIGNEMLQYENVTSHDDMARQFTLLNGRWTDIISQIDKRHKTLTSAADQYAQFQVLCEEETSWLDQLEQKLEKSSKSAADAEEISEALDDLEIFLHGHHEERLQKVRELAEQLVQEGVMTFAVQNSTHDLTSRFNSLNAQANEQRTTLEGGVREAQAWEREYISVLEWLTHTDVVITQAVADPSTHLEGTDEVLKELSRQQEVLAKMEAQVQVYQSGGKPEAAQRLEDQVVHLRKKYEEVQGKLQQLNSAPNDFEARLKTMDAQLHDISQSVQLVSLTAGNPNAIQEQLNLCLQLYRTLSEVKGEVESVIATGRKIVKENQTSNPEGLTQQLDQLKALYNELGKAVTEQRGILEQSLRQSKKILKDGQHLEDWLSTTEHDLDTREATLPLRSVQHELHFAQSEQDRKKDEMEKFIVGLGEIKGWLEVTENKLSNLTRYPAEERASIIKKVSQEVQDYKGQIESIRDTSVELISHGELFESRVQPELVTINQRWEHIFKTVTREDLSVVVSSETSVSSRATTDDNKTFDTSISPPTTTTTTTSLSDPSSHSTISTITKVFTTYATTYATTSADTDTGSIPITDFPSSQLTDQTAGEITKVIGVPALSAATAVADVPVGGTADVPVDFQLTYSSTDDTFKDLIITSDEMETSPIPEPQEQATLEVTELTRNISASKNDRSLLEVSDIIVPTITEDQPDLNSTKIVDIVSLEAIPSKTESQVTNTTAALVVDEADSAVCGEGQSEKHPVEQEQEKEEAVRIVSGKSGDRSPTLSDTGDCSMMMVTSTIKRKVDITTEKPEAEPVDLVITKPVCIEKTRTVEPLAKEAKTDDIKENISLVEVEEVKTTISHLSFNIPGNEALKNDVSHETSFDSGEKKATTPLSSEAQSPLSEKAQNKASSAAQLDSDRKDKKRKLVESETEPDNLDEVIAGLKEVAEKDIDPNLLEMCARRRKSSYREVPDSESGTEERFPLVKIRRRDDDDLESLASIDTDMAPASETSRDFEGTFSDLESVAESVSSRGDSLFSASYNQGIVSSESSSRIEDMKLPEIPSIYTVSSTLVQANVNKQETSQILSQHDSQHWSLTSADTMESDFVMDTSVGKETEDSLSTGSAALEDKTKVKENSKASARDGKTEIRKKEKAVEYQKLPVEKLQAMLAELDEVMGDNEVSDTEDEAEEIKDECVMENEEQQGPRIECQEPRDLQTSKSEIVNVKVAKSLPVVGKPGAVVSSSYENETEVPLKEMKLNTKTVQFTDTLVKEPRKEMVDKDPEGKMVAYEFTMQEIHVGGDLEFGRAKGSVEEGVKMKTLEVPSQVKVHETEVKEDSVTEKPFSGVKQKHDEEQTSSPEVVKVSVQSSEVVHGVTLVSSKEEMLPQAEEATLVTLISRPVSEETLLTDNDTVMEESEAILTSTTSSSLEAVVAPKAMQVFQAEDKLCDVITPPSSSSASSPLVSSSKEEGRHGHWSKDVAQVIGKTVQEEMEKQEAEAVVPDTKVETQKEVVQKVSSLPGISKIVTHVMTKTTITSSSTSTSSVKEFQKEPSFASSQVARPDEDQVDLYLREVSSMSDKITALKYKTKDIPHFNEAKEKVEGLEHEVALLEPDVATVISRGDTLTLTTHMVDVPRANSIRLAVNDLRQQWSTLKADTEHLKNETDLVNREMENYPEKVDTLITWLNEVTKRLDLVNNDESQLEALEKEMASKKEQIDQINETGERMKKYQYVQLQPILTLINTRWTELTMQFRQYRKVPHETKTIVPGSKDAAVLEPSKVPDYVASVNRLREAISAISRQLNAPLMNGKEFDNLNAQEEELKVIKQGLDTLKPRVDSTETEREGVMNSATQSEADQVRRVVDKLRQEWAQVNRGYTEHHARWLHASESLRSLHKMTEDFSVWLSSIEEKVQTTTNQPLPEAKTTQKDLEKQVTLKHRPSQNLQTKCKEITEEMNVEDGRRLQDRVDNLMKRWRSLLLDLAARRERIAAEETGKDTSTDYEDLVAWIDQAQGLMDAPVNVTDEASLSAHITMVQNHIIECGGKQVLLKRLKEGKPKGVTPAQIATLETNMTKIANLLPEYKNNLDTKQGVIKTLGDNVEDLYKWTEEMRVRVALHNLTQDEVKQMKATLREKTAWYESLDSTYWVLAQDAESRGLAVSVALKNRMNSIESRLKALQAQLAESSASSASPSASFGLAAAGARESGGDEQENKKKVIVEAEVEAVKEDDMASSMSSSVTSSVTTVIHNIRMEESVLSTEGDIRPPSPLVCPPKHSPDSSPAVVLASLDKSILQIRDWLTLVEQMVKQQTAVVGDSDDIRTLIEKQKSVLRELESKKPQLDELVASADSLKDDASRTQLHQKVSKLREHWDETNSSVLQRKTQLDVMMADTHKFDVKRAEVETWLARLEARMERMAPVAHTADILDQQIREQKGIHAELHQYKHQMELFNQMTQRLITIYQHDDTRKIKKITETINMRYSNLSSSIIARGKVLHSAMNSLHNFDKALDKFRAWLSETESLADQLDMEVDKLGPGRREMQPRGPSIHLKDLQSEIESHKDVLASLNATGQKLLGTLDNQDEAVMLQRRLEEMNQRWNNLKHKSMAIRNRLEGNAENWNSLLLSLRELIEWVIRKDTELNALGPLVGDISALTKYEEDLTVFRRVLDEKQPVIESNLKSGRQLIASEPPLSDTSDSEAGRDLDGDNRYRGEETARDLTRSVRREVAKLSEKWAALRERAGATASQANLANKKLGVLQKTVEEVGGRLEEAEKTVAAWGAVPQDPNLADQHVHNVKKFREGLADLQRGVDDVNDQAARFSAHNVPLTPANSARLHDLNNRWKTLETTVNDRWRQLAGRSREVTPMTPAQLASSVAPPWERATASNKVPYYINHDRESTHWDHPDMMELLDSMAQYNHIKFSAYRTAMKLRTLQKKLALEYAKLQTATGIFDEHGLRGQNDRLIDVNDMVVVLSALYASIASDHPEVNTTLAMDLCLNWLLNVYDSQRTGQMRVLSFKVGLVCLCTGHLEEKYRYMFRLIADLNRLVDQRKLGLLLHDCVQVPRQLGEVAAFGGSNIEPSVRSCFTKAGKDRETIEAVHFLSWVQQEPQSLVWLAVLHRVAASENVHHQVKCNICKAYPVVGLRYRCLKCLSFDMCQQCFFGGRSNKSHKVTHPMHEYCTATTTGEDMKDFTKALKNKFKSKRSLQKHAKKGYLPVQTVLEGDALESPAPSPQHNVSSQDMHTRLEMYASRLAEVELRTNSNSTPDSEDEHGLIAQYCQSLSSSDAPLPVPRSPLQIMAAVDAEQKEELEAMIRDLEEENKVLQAEYDRLKAQKPVGSPPEDFGPQGRSETDMIAEAKLLREHKGRLEARMSILEEHNRQLEAQLHRLRQLLEEPSGASSPNKSGTLQTKSVTASQLAMDSPAKVNGHSTAQGGSGGPYEGLEQMSEYVRPPPPPLGSMSHVGNLFSRAGDLGKAVGTLVATMTDEGEKDSRSSHHSTEDSE